MKKQIIVSSFIAAAILGGTVVLSVARAEGPKDEEPKLLATNSVITTPSPIINSSKTETVYAIDDENGNTKSKFIGSALYSGAEELPFSMKVTYYLDGNQVSAKDLSGKSGHVKIVFSYDSTATYNGSYIPFLALTTINLDRLKFSNIRLTGGKIFNENSSTATILGYSVTGMSKNLGTNFLPDNFILEADTTNFKLGDTYTIFTNDVLTDIDTSKLNRVDELTNSMYQLEDGINKLVNGSAELANGLSSALDGTKTLYEGSKTLASGTKDAAAGATQATTGATKLKDGLTTLTGYNEKLQAGATSIIQTTLVGTTENPGLNPAIQANAALMAAITAYQIDFPITVTNYTDSIEAIKAIAPAMAASLDKAKDSLDFATGIIGYTNGVADAATGATTLTTGLTELSTGLTKLSDGATTISNGLGSLVEGQNKLYQGSITLRDGLSTFKSSGIDKLVDFANKDLASFTRNLRGTITAANNYKSFGGVDAKSVKFIVKTPAI